MILVIIEVLPCTLFLHGLHLNPHRHSSWQNSPMIVHGHFWQVDLHVQQVSLDNSYESFKITKIIATAIFVNLYFLIKVRWWRGFTIRWCHFHTCNDVINIHVYVMSPFTCFKGFQNWNDCITVTVRVPFNTKLQSLRMSHMHYCECYLTPINYYIMHSHNWIKNNFVGCKIAFNFQYTITLT